MKLQKAIELSRIEIRNIQRENKFLHAGEMLIFDAHLAILDDPLIASELKLLIETRQVSALQAVRQVIRHFEQMFEKMNDEYMRERAQDLRDIGNRVVKNIVGLKAEELPDDQPYILFARELSPSLSAQLDPHKVQAIVTMSGSATSHASIMARALGIPYVVGLDEQFAAAVHSGDLLAVDGERGIVCLNPEAEQLDEMQHLLNRWFEYRDRLLQLRPLACQTKDGQAMLLTANLSSAHEVSHALQQGAVGVGLFRSEYLFLESAAPLDEESQFEVYREIARAFAPRHVVIRTVDIGGDKPLPGMSPSHEDNPFLGLRGIRLSMSQASMLDVQLRAVLRASAWGQIKVMIPMVSSLDEVLYVKRRMSALTDALRAQGVACADKVPLGIMVEVPGVAFIIDQLATEVDFFSIGTNDLLQYTLAVDRLNERIAHLYDSYHPAFIRLLMQIRQAVKATGKPLCICGEMAGDIQALPLWVALGVEELSMSAGQLLPIKQVVLSARAAQWQSLPEQLLACRTSAEIRQLLENALAGD
jgi:phosphotransferase system enzyme I (PtsI)